MPNLDAGPNFVNGDDATAEVFNDRFEKIENWANDSIASVLLGQATPGQIIVVGNDGKPAYVTMSGDAQIDSSGAVTIGQERFGFPMEEYAKQHTVSGSGTETVLSEEPDPGRYLVFVFALYFDTESSNAGGFVQLFKGETNINGNVFGALAGASNRSVFYVKEVEISEGESLSVRYVNTGTVTGQRLDVVLTLLKLPEESA